MKKVAVLLSLVALFTVSCVESESDSNVSWTLCKQNSLKSSELSNKIDVDFNDKGVQITYCNFAVSCDFTTVNVSHTFVNGVLNITQQGFPNQANCVCYTDVSYTINRILQNEVNVIFINGEQVYCHNDATDGYGFVTFGANYHVINCISTVTVFLDRENIGDLQNPTEAINDCGEAENLTKKISVGEHTYRIEIRGGCTNDITGTFVMSENECKKIFIDYYRIFGNQPNCDQNVIISKTEYENAPNHFVTILDMNIEDNCLKIKFGASGCSGDNWTVKLIDCEAVAESMPCQRTLRLSLNDIGECAAYFEKEMSFNIQNLQIRGDRSVQLNILGKSILYEY